MHSFWAGEKPQTMPLPKQRRAIISFEMDIEWAALTLDSRHARFEHPKPLPSDAIDLFGRCIRVGCPADFLGPTFRSKFEFHIIYACETLDFSTAYFPQHPNGKSEWIRLGIRGGGGFESSVSYHGRERIFQSHKNIATDPNAEEVP